MWKNIVFDVRSFFSSVCFVFLDGGFMYSVFSNGIFLFIRSSGFFNSGVRV